MSLYVFSQYESCPGKTDAHGSVNDPAVGNAFYYLLSDYAGGKDLKLIAEVATADEENNLLFICLGAEKSMSGLTNGALDLFNNYYPQNESASPVCFAGSSELRSEFMHDMLPPNLITKEDIVFYVHAVLHHLLYRSQQPLNYKCGLLPIPLYDSFNQWAASGKRLMDWHIN